MSNHLHLILQSDNIHLSEIFRDFKKYTSSIIVKAIETKPKESRKSWLLWLLKKEAGICFWEQGYHGEEIVSVEFLKSKINYTHLNPVRAGLVEKEEDYLLSSYADYCGTRKGLLKLAFA